MNKLISTCPDSPPPLAFKEHSRWAVLQQMSSAPLKLPTCATAVSTGSCTRYLRARLTTTAAQCRRQNGHLSNEHKQILHA